MVQEQIKQHLYQTAWQKLQIVQIKVNMALKVFQKPSSHQAGHVGEVAVPQRCDEVVHQPELGGLPVDVGWDEQEARLGTQHSVGRQQVLAGAPLRTQHRRGTGGDGRQEDEEEEEERADK